MHHIYLGKYLPVLVMGVYLQSQVWKSIINHSSSNHLIHRGVWWVRLPWLGVSQVWAERGMSSYPICIRSMEMLTLVLFHLSKVEIHLLNLMLLLHTDSRGCNKYQNNLLRSSSSHRVGRKSKLGSSHLNKHWKMLQKLRKSLKNNTLSQKLKSEHLKQLRRRDLKNLKENP